LYRLRAQAFVIVDKHDPVVRALRQGEGARLVGGRLFHHDHLIGELQRTQASADEGGTVERNDESADLLACGMHR
jgi:hypothetical protein